MIWYTDIFGIMVMGILLYRQTLWSKIFIFMFDLESNDSLIWAHHVRMGHHYNFASSVDHSRSNSVVLLAYDGMQKYSGHRYCTTGILGQRQPYPDRLISQIDHIV